MNKQDYAAHVKRLREDETLTSVIKGIQDDALTIFMNPNSDAERILEAHQSIQAVGILANAFDAIEADAIIENDRES